MKVVFHEDFCKVDYVIDGASVPGRMEAVMSELKTTSGYFIVSPSRVSVEDLLIAHPQEYIESIMQDKKLFEMAALSAGGAMLASQIAMGGEPCFAAIRPPGHHASKSSSWGYCHFGNMAIAIKKLLLSNQAKSAFILDIDAHTGDGTIDILNGVEGVKILNPFADNAKNYIKVLGEYLQKLENVDIIAVCAGFDNYELDLGKKLSTFDFYQIGYMIKLLCRRMGHNRRFAVLEGGYYLPDLGKNVLAFCQGFE